MKHKNYRFLSAALKTLSIVILSVIATLLTALRASDDEYPRAQSAATASFLSSFCESVLPVATARISSEQTYSCGDLRPSVIIVFAIFAKSVTAFLLIKNARSLAASSASVAPS